MGGQRAHRPSERGPRRVSSTPTESTIPSSTGVSLRTRTVIVSIEPSFDPDLRHPRVYGGESIEFSYPGNWYAELEETEGGAESISLTGMAGYINILVYEASETPQEELETVLLGGSRRDLERLRGR